MAMSASGFGAEDAPMSEINTTPLVDVMLVLLIIFLIAVPVAIQTIEKLRIPVFASVESKDKVENLLCNIFDGGTTKVYFRFADTGQKVLARHMAIKDDPLLRAELERILGKDHVKVQTAEQNAK